MSHSSLQLIVGLGITGFSCAQYFQKKGIPFAVMDTRATPPHLSELKALCPDVRLSLGTFNTSWMEKAARIILSPGISVKHPLIAEQIERGLPVVGDIELFAESVAAPVIAITGTNAKSTVTTLVGLMAQAAQIKTAVGGNLGQAALSLLDDHAGLYVLELSSFQLETTHTLKPNIATILNISPDHMDRYDSLLDYQRAKYRIYTHSSQAVCNRDDQLTDYREGDQNNKWYFSLNQPSAREFGLMTQKNESYLAYEDQLLMPTKDLPISGKHYYANALAALAIGHASGFPLDTMLDVLRSFKGLPHRCQLIRKREEVLWVNDSKGTNVGATIAAINGLGAENEGKLVMILGGIGKHADFTTLLPVLLQYGRHVVLIGEAAKEIANVIGNALPFSFASDMEEAVSEAAKVSQPKDIVLLSPACSSLDMYQNFEHRGRVFTEIVERL